MYQTTVLDPKGKVVKSYDIDLSADWRVLKPGGMMEKLFVPACKWIEAKRRNP